jgi:hypothetical protein
MPNPANLADLKSLDKDQLIRLSIEALRRSVIHYGCWYRELEDRFGSAKANRIENEAGDQAIQLILTRMAKVLGFQLKDGFPDYLQQMSQDQLIAFYDSMCANWLALDGLLFQSAETQEGMDAAKGCNDACWCHYSPYEAHRVKRLLGLEDNCGLVGLQKAIELRLYSRLNRQSFEMLDANTAIFKTLSCRVQDARMRKSMPSYPCRSAGIAEFTSFASAIDSRIKTECVACPPDEHPKDWWCAWKFTLYEGGSK